MSPMGEHALRREIDTSTETEPIGRYMEEACQHWYLVIRSAIASVPIYHLFSCCDLKSRLRRPPQYLGARVTADSQLNAL